MRKREILDVRWRTLVAVVALAGSALALPTTTGEVAAATLANSAAPRTVVSSAQVLPVPAAALNLKEDLSAMSCPSENACTAVGSAGDASQATPSPLALAQGSSGWTATVLPLPSGTYAFGSINAVACPAAGECTAIGTYTNSVDAQEGLIESETAGKWSVITAPLLGSVSGNPDVSLGALSCPSAGNCLIIGDYASGGALIDFADVETADEWTATLLYPSGIVNGALAGEALNAVTCVSAGACVVIGSYSDDNGPHVFIDTLESGKWAASTVSLSPTPEVADTIEVPEVYCSSVGNCVAAGSYYSGSTSLTQVGMLLTDSSGTWSYLEAPLPADATRGGGLNLVGCWGAGDCTAIGTYNTSTGSGSLILSDSGGTWTLEPAPITSEYPVTLTSIACASSASCAIGGWDYNDSHVAEEVLLYGGGSTWAQASPTLPADSAGPYGSTPAESGACFADGTCTLIGDYSHVDDNAVEGDIASESGGNWTLTQTQNPVVADPYVTVTGESCPSADNCTIDGYYASPVQVQQGFVTEQPLFEQETDGTWAVSTPPSLPSGVPGIAQLGPVSCTAPSDCVAAGVAISDGVPTLPIVFTETSGSWTAQSVPTPSGGHPYAELQISAISCGSATNCAAVGSYIDYVTDENTVQQGLLLTDAGGTWSALSVCTPTSDDPSGISSSVCPYDTLGSAAGTALTLTGVSCSTTDCAAVGVSTAGQYASTPYISAATFSDSGGTWTGTFTNWSNYNTGQLGTVSCPVDGSCTAIGSFGPQVYLFMLTSGAWSDTPVDPPGAGAATATAISCIAATSCTAFGTYDLAGVSTPFTYTEGGGTWQFENAAVPADGAKGGVSATGAMVSCAVAGWCEMGATYKDTAGLIDGLIEDQAAGTVGPEDAYGLQLPAGAAAASGTIAGLVCTGVQLCSVSGSYLTSAGLHEGFVDGLSAGVTVSRLSVTSGAPTGGTSVTVSGSGFESEDGSTTEVEFGGVAATDVNVVNNDELTAVSPAQKPGPVNVSVTSQWGTSATGTASTFSYVLTPSMRVSVSPTTPAVYGREQVAKVSVALTGADSDVPTGTVTLTYGKAKLTAFTLKNGANSWTLTAVALPAGKDPIVASYSGDTLFVPVSNAKAPAYITISREATTSALTVSPTTIAAGKEKSLVFTVKVTPQYAGVATGVVRVLAGTLLVCKVTITTGSGRCSPTSATVLIVGNHTLNASYAGNTDVDTSKSKGVPLKVT